MPSAFSHFSLYYDFGYTQYLYLFNLPSAFSHFSLHYDFGQTQCRNPITSKPPLFYLYLLSCSKTCNSKVDICYSASINVYGFVKLNTVLLDPIIKYNQLGSETREPNNCSRRTGLSRSQHENSYAGSSSLVKLSCKSGKPKIVDAFSASPAHTHNSTIDEKGHPRKPDEKNKSVEGSNMRTTQVNTGRTLSIQLRARSAKNVAWRLKDLHTGRMETA